MLSDLSPQVGRGLTNDNAFSGYLKMDAAIIYRPSSTNRTCRAHCTLPWKRRPTFQQLPCCIDTSCLRGRCSHLLGMVPQAEPLPLPATVAAFLAHQVKAGIKPSTLGRRVAAIKYAHRRANEEPPTDDERAKAVLQGARCTLGVAPRKLAAATSEKTIGMATLVRPGLAGLRDRAILLLALPLAARWSELVALDVEDIEECPEGLRVRIRRSKTDQEGEGAVVAVCRGSIADPVSAVLDYIKAANITSGARSGVSGAATTSPSTG
jgi:hypothetical protein